MDNEKNESLSSVKLTRNAKGGTQIEVKVYDLSPDMAAKLAKETYGKLREEYSE